MAESIKDIIQKPVSRKRYEFLKRFNNLTEDEKTEISRFEQENKPKQVFTLKEVKSRPNGKILNKETLWKAFLKEYFEQNKVNFQKTHDSVINVSSVMKYFLRDETFFDSLNLVTSFDKGKLTPSFDKGLLIIGNYGNGKSSMLRALSGAINNMYLQAYNENWQTLPQWQSVRFSYHNVHDVVTDFECIDNNESRANFYKKYSGFRHCYDDIKKEKIASNFGKTNLMKEIIEKRYDNKAKTFAICNYDDAFPNNLEHAVLEFGAKYGGHVLDRIFEMFNILEFKGKSFRK
ncbi:hypothetical protein K5I29_04095 [Flavobacterium agricola]|uniref:DNA replication protein DnaC n=1 Tax=Flavobacterium agricola TaxID=2870839 RepID=A0ABY6M0L2_9FLAO|nr:hypothetical protein [Flavobacterium agricola]UYW02090.1 hypothetical protein K5I29_04095 [Flavobacterium agricola]